MAGSTNLGTAPGASSGSPPGPARNNYRYIRWALWTAAILTMCLLGLIPLALVAASTLSGALVGLVLAVLPVPLYLAFALWIDRYEKEPIRMLALAFLWGATVAIFFSVVISLIGSGLVGVFLGASAADFAATVIFAPVVEECMKALALFILFFWKKDEFDNVVDGIVYAAMVGLGFTLMEDIFYHASAFAEAGLAGSLGTFVLRGVLSPWGHPIYTSMVGIGLGLARQSSKRSVKLLAPAAGLLLAIVLHAVWNGAGYVLPGAYGFVFLFLIFMPTLIIGVTAVGLFALSREGRVVRRYLEPELQYGLITHPEYEALGSVWGRIRSSLRAFSVGGFGGWRAYSRFAQVATELAFHRDRVARGLTSVDAASRETAYVRSLREITGRGA